jgi:Carboxypeptidase regulatory-like domain
MLYRSISILFASLLLAVCASSQIQTTGRITGTVTDALGAVIAGAQINIENPATGDKHSGTSDSSGNYSILQLLPATYDVKITAQGFTPAVFHAITIGSGETSTIKRNSTGRPEYGGGDGNRCTTDDPN